MDAILGKKNSFKKILNINVNKKNRDKNFISNAINSINIMRKLNLSSTRINNINNNINNFLISNNFLRKDNNNMHNNNSINKINNTKRFYSKNKPENKKLSCPSSAIKGTYKQYKNKAKTIKINSILPLNNSDFDKYIDKHENLSLKLIDVSNKNNNSIKNNEVIKKYKNNISKESINKFKKIKIEDYTTKKINDIQNKKD